MRGEGGTRRKVGGKGVRDLSETQVMLWYTLSFFQFRHTVEGGVAGNVMVELPQAGSATTFYGEEPTTGT